MVDVEAPQQQQQMPAIAPMETDDGSHEPTTVAEFSVPAASHPIPQPHEQADVDMELGASGPTPAVGHEPFHHHHRQEIQEQQPIEQGQASEEVPPLVDASAVVPVAYAEQPHHEGFGHVEDAGVSSTGNQKSSFPMR